MRAALAVRRRLIALAVHFRRMRRVKPYTVGPGTLLQSSFDIGLRLGSPTGRVKIGEDSVLECTIILERDVGTVYIGDRSYVGGGTQLVCAERISIGSDVMIAWGCTIADHDSHSLDWRHRAEDVRRWREGLRFGVPEAARLKDWSHVAVKPVVVSDKAWLGFGVIVVKGVTIGEGAVVAAGSVVTRDVAEWTLVGGNPARVIRELPRPDQE